MSEQKILVMRHAEKTEDPRDPDLSNDGFERAKRLVTWLPDQFGNPDFIIATAPSKHSMRPIETVKPLAKKLDVDIDDSLADQEYGVLADKLLTKKRFQDKITLVCWHHGNIPNLMNALHCKPDSYPYPWDRDIFNLVLVVTFGPDGTPTVDQVVEPF
ncbi:histidine phosphatase family protein [Beijerinckia sp. L45]|uniref:histidine phosphatase family protein n=1 Tax=Beijerinckia sp. L45 TaxID=1641855 RepID=UPI00131E95E8|nr:histidine phosphatase family protein [Beijerinckia sp. L45]